MRLCRIVFLGFGLLWVLALVVFAIGTFGFFGQEKDPLSGVFLILLGLPWIRFVDAGGLWMMLLAPGVNFAIIGLICRALGTRSGK